MIRGRGDPLFLIDGQGAALQFDADSFKTIFTTQRIKELLSLLDNYADLVSPTQRTDVCRDAKYNFLLEVALEGKVDYLVTGDDDLLVLESFHDIQIINPKHFRHVLRSKKK